MDVAAVAAAAVVCMVQYARALNASYVKVRL
jgi:hypothetical protein